MKVSAAKKTVAVILLVVLLALCLFSCSDARENGVTVVYIFDADTRYSGKTEISDFPSVGSPVHFPEEFDLSEPIAAPVG